MYTHTHTHIYHCVSVAEFFAYLTSVFIGADPHNMPVCVCFSVCIFITYINTGTDCGQKKSGDHLVSMN